MKCMGRKEINIIFIVKFENKYICNYIIIMKLKLE